MSDYDTQKTVWDMDILEEIRELKRMGFKAAWISDLKEGDLFAGPRIFGFDPPREIFFLERINVKDGSYVDEAGTFIPNNVVSMIVIDAEGLERHLCYGGSHEIYIWHDSGQKYQIVPV